jgi:Tol biopolymer transport system component
MKRNFILVLFLSLFLGTLFAQEAVKDIYWDKEQGILSYSIPKDCLLKIRVGSAKGPVYRTLVNLEKRKAGTNQELWDGRDESGLIDFRDYGPLHFCVDIIPKPKKDLLLRVNLPKEMPIEKGTLKVTQALSIKVDIDEKDKEWFCKEGIEIMAFLDNQLIKLERAKALPYSLNLDFKSSSEGKHLLTLNVWSGDHASVAYKNLLILLEREKESSPTKRKEKPKTLSGKISYCQRHKGFWQVYVANLDGSKPRQLTKSPIDKRYPDFSPDGKRIAYVSNQGELWITDIDSRNSHKIFLPVHASQPCWSPDGKRIAFVSYQDLYHGDSEIWEIDLETLKLKKLTSRPWLQYDLYYSPDESNVLFTDGPELYAQEIRKLDLKTGDITQLTDNQPYDYDMQPAYSPDGEMVVYSCNETGNYDIWIMDKFGQAKHNLTQNPAYDIMPQITKDGRWIFFLSDRTGSLEVWRMDPDGSNQRQISKTERDKQDLTVHTVLK